MLEEPEGGTCSRIVERETGRRVEFLTRLTIGRHPENGLSLAYPAVSSHHAVIERREDGWVLRDLDSRNGTTLNGRRLRGFSRLWAGDVVRVAGVATLDVADLADTPPEMAIGATAWRDDGIPADLALELRWTGPARGQVSVQAGGASATFIAQQSFVLLEQLARQPGAWVADADLKSALWGRGADQVTRGAFYNLLFAVRRQLDACGAPGFLVEKNEGATRLSMDPGRVRILPPGTAGLGV